MEYQDTRDALNGTQGMKNSPRKVEAKKGRKGFIITVDDKPREFSRTYAGAEKKAEKLRLYYEYSRHDVNIRCEREFTFI